MHHAVASALSRGPLSSNPHSIATWSKEAVGIAEVVAQDLEAQGYGFDAPPKSVHVNVAVGPDGQDAPARAQPTPKGGK
jgi:hypothetical protein